MSAKKTVRDLMTRPAATVRPDDSLENAVRLMRDRDCGCVAVVDPALSVLALLTDRDACLALLRSGRTLRETSVRESMGSRVFTCRSGDPIAEAERLMGLHQVRRLPVVDGDGRLVGVLSLDDIAREARREQDLIAPEVAVEHVGRTLGEIGRPRLVESGGP